MPTIYKPKKKKQRTKTDNTIEVSRYYNSKYWKKLRNQYIAEHPLCEDCIIDGISRPAEEVHHLVPWQTGTTEEEKWDLLLDPNNIISLCIHHHKERHKQLNRH